MGEEKVEEKGPSWLGKFGRFIGWEGLSLILNLLALAGLLGLAWYSIRNDMWVVVAVSVGGVGGLLHEFVQSGGRIIFT